MPDELVQFAGSLVAILLLAGLAWRLKLGPAPALADETDARRAASEAVDGFDAVDVALDSGGHGALLCDRVGRILLLRQHGTHFAGRLLGPAAHAQVHGDVLTVHTGEARFGSASFTLDDAKAWVRRIEAIG